MVAAGLQQQLRTLANHGRFSGELRVSAPGTETDDTFGSARAGAIYKVGSVTKLFTATSLLLLAQANRLDLQAPLARFFPEIDAAQLASKGQPVRLAHLLSHTSGLDLELPSGRELPPERIVSALARATFHAPPGTSFAYSNGGYLVLGQVLRRVTGSSFEVVVRNAITTPLALPDTGIVPSGEQRQRMSPGQVGSLIGLHPAGATFPDLLHGTYDWSEGSSGAIFSTAKDLARFLEAVFAGSLLDARSRALLTSEASPGFAHGIALETAGSPAEPIYWHNGILSPMGYQAVVMYCPRESLATVVLASVDETVIDLTQVFRTAIKGTPTDAAKIPPTGFTFERFLVTLRVLHVGPIAAGLGYLIVLWFSTRKRWNASTSLVAGSAALLLTAAGFSFSDFGLQLKACLVAAALSAALFWRGRRRSESRAPASRASLILSGNACLVALYLVLLNRPSA